MPYTRDQFVNEYYGAADRIGAIMDKNNERVSQMRMAEMAAARMEGLGPQGQYWAQQIRTDPRAALKLSEQYGGFGQIEADLSAARAQGEAAKEFRRLRESGAKPQDIVDWAITAYGPEAAAKLADSFGLKPGDGPASYTTADGVFVRDPSAPDGYRNAGAAPQRGPLVQIGDSGFKPEQAAAAEDRAASQVDSRVKPLQDALDAYSSLTAVVKRIRAEGREPNQSETDTIVKLASRLENPEAVQEGDIARKAGGTFWNAARAKFGMGVVLDPGRLDTIMSVADTIASEKAKRLAEVQAEAKAVAEERGLNPRAVSPAGRVIPSGMLESQRPPSMEELISMPVGATFTDAEGTWVKTNRTAPNGDPIFEEVE